MPLGMQSARIVRFGAFEFNPHSGELRKHGLKIKIQDQPLQILVLLLEQPGQVVTREQVHHQLWPDGTFVDFEHGLNAAVQRLRQALGDTAANPRFVETLSRRGYRFVAPVQVEGVVETGTGESPGPHSRLQWVVGGAAVLLAAAGFFVWLFRPARNAAPRAVPFTTYPGRQITPALSPDGKQVAFAWDGEKSENFDIYVKLVNAGAALRLTSNPANEYSPAWSPDGRYLAFCRDSPVKPATDSSSLAQQIFGIFVNHVDIWTIPALGGEQKVGEAAGCGLLSWSPDGKYLALADKAASRDPDAGQTDVIDIYIISADGGAPHRLTSGRWKNARPSWSRDGKWVYFGSNRSGDWQIWKQRAAGDEAVQVSKSGGEEAFESADGKYVYWAKRDVTGIWRISVEGGEESRALDASTEGLWALTSQGICFFELKAPADLSLKFYSFATGKTTPLRQFPRGTKIDALSTALTVSPDGQWILYPQFDQAGSDLMLVDDFR
jgi:DNA-binding winged helix-turn-helix (wHTH) protein/dipeptidyl aminopeptidase/acylaminoacyl peptidase